MGLGLYFADGEGPKFERPLRDEAAVMKLAAPDPTAELRYVTDAVEAAGSEQILAVPVSILFDQLPHCARVHPARLVAGLADAVERRGG